MGHLGQITARHAASSYNQVLVPKFAQAGGKLRRVLTDWRTEFKEQLGQACGAPGFRTQGRTLAEVSWRLLAHASPRELYRIQRPQHRPLT